MLFLIKTHNYRKKASEKRKKNVVQYANEWKSTDVFGNECGQYFQEFLIGIQCC